MKKRTAALIAVICVLFTGCALNNSGDKKPISVPYSAMINPKGAPQAQNETVTEQANAQNRIADPAEPAPAAPSVQPDETPARSSVTPKAAPAAEESKPASAQEKAAAADTPKETSAPETKPKLELVTPTKTPDKTAGKTDNKDVANTPLGEICYLPYKTAEPEEPEKAPTEESGSESKTESKPKKEKPKYDYGYRVVFRTNTDTYLMGVTPYKSCKWDDIGKVCRELKDKIEADCEIVGAPSLDDLKLFTEAGIYFPEKHEIWTSTLTAEKGFKAYYRNSKGTFYSTRSTSDICGVCVIIKIKTSQSNSELLSNSQSNFAQLKAQLEKEEAEFKKSASGS